MVLNREGKIFVGRRNDTPFEAWQMPQGGVDEGEDLEAAALRELEEEIGTRQVDVLGRTRGWLTYDLPAELIGKAWGGRYRGQKQVWFAMRLDGPDELIDIHTDHAEFCDWRWVPKAVLVDIIIPFKRPVYEQVIAELGRFARPLDAPAGLPSNARKTRKS